MKVALYARVSKQDQKTLAAQLKAMRSYARKRRWTIAVEVKDVGSGAKEREARQGLLDAAIRRKVDVVLVWKLDRWGRSMIDLMTTLRDLSDVGVGFVSMTEALDLTTSSGRALAGMLGVFAEFERDLLSERIKAGIVEARMNGRPHGRPVTVGNETAQIKKLFAKGVSKAEIARRLGIGRTSVRRLLGSKS